MGSPLHQEIHGVPRSPPPPRETKLVFGPNADMQKLQRWLPENVAARQTSAMTMNPRDEFAEALRFLDCVASVEHPMMDGQKPGLRFRARSENTGSGFYVGQLDGHPAGYIKNNKIGSEMR